MNDFFNPPKQGPKCLDCPLYRDGHSINDRIPDGETWSELTILLDRPGKGKVQNHSPLLSPAGGLLDALLDQLGMIDVHLTNAIVCQEQEGVKLKEEEIQRALECCRAHRHANLEIMQPKVVLCLGSVAVKSELVDTSPARGAFYEGKGYSMPWKVTCSLHPSMFLQKDGKHNMVEFLRDDMLKAYRVAGGEEIWKPVVRDARNFNSLMDFLNRAHAAKGPIACDLETDSLDEFSANIHLIGLAHKDESFSVPFNGDNQLYPDFWQLEQWNQIETKLVEMLSDPQVHWVFQNKQFDVVILERFFCPVKGLRHDTMLLHHAVYPKTPHDLASIHAQLFPSEPWKQNFDLKEKMKQTDWEQDDLGRFLYYNAYDAAATLADYKALLHQVSSLGLRQLVDADRRLTDLTIDWFRTGVWIDLDAAKELEVEYREELDQLAHELRESACNPELNLDSPKQLVKVLYDHFKLVPTKRSEKTGQPSTSQAALLEYVNEHHFVARLFKYRERSKLYSTYIKGIEDRMRGQRLHSTYNLTSTPTGRFGTSPAIQNWPMSMRRMISAPPGRVLVGADFAALEIRMGALLAGEEALIDAFVNNEDIHAKHAHWFFGPLWEEADDKLKKILRTRSKPVTFLKIYRGGVDMMYENLRPDRLDDDPADLRREIKIMSDTIDEKYPNMVKAAELYRRLAGRNHHLSTYLLGRIRKWPFSRKWPVKPTEAANHPIQGSAADLVNQATLRWVDDLKKKGWYHDGVWPNLQIHDALYAEVVEDMADEVAAHMEAVLYTELTLRSPLTNKDYTMAFPVETKKGKNLQTLE